MNIPGIKPQCPTSRWRRISTLFVISLGIFLMTEGTASAVCSSTPTSLCVQGNRFRVEVDWRGFGTDGGVARVASPKTADSGLFYFFGQNNWEILVKVLDACGANGNNHFWVFAASATTLEFTLKVTDTMTGAVQTYFNPLGNPAAAITDTLAFATCNGTPVQQPPLVRYLNNLVCGGQGFTSVLSVNGFSWTSFSGSVSPYQVVNRSSLGPVFTEVNDSLCPNATYGGTLSIAKDRQYALVQTLQNGSRILGIVDEGPQGTTEPADLVSSRPEHPIAADEVEKE